MFNDIAVFGDTNLELPSFLSNRSAVEIHLDIDPNTFLQPAAISIELPLHARYQVRLLQLNLYLMPLLAKPSFFPFCFSASE